MPGRGDGATCEQLAAPSLRWSGPDSSDPTGVTQHAVGDDLEQRADGGLVEVGVVGHGGDAADEAAHLHGLDVLAQRVLLLEPVDDALRRPR